MKTKNTNTIKQVLEPLAMTLLAAALFWAASKIDTESIVDKIMVPMVYVCAALSLLTAIYMALPAGRKLSAQIADIQRQEKEVFRAQIKTKSDIFILTLRKVYSRNLPILVVLMLLVVFEKINSLSAPFFAWCILVALDFLITYFLLTHQSKKH